MLNRPHASTAKEAENKPQHSFPALLRTKDVLRLVPVTRVTVYHLVRRGEFPAPIVLRGRNYWPEDEVRGWLAAWRVRRAQLAAERQARRAQRAGVAA